MAKAKVDGRSKQGKQRKKWREEKSGRRQRKRDAATGAKKQKAGQDALDAKGSKKGSRKGSREPSLAELKHRKRDVEGVPGGGGAVGAALDKKVKKVARKNKKPTIPSWKRPAR
tara:strand:+ start:698 stop:1039 length:342 start_codon:yes stop_codon:yes gene_type:complete